MGESAIVTKWTFRHLPVPAYLSFEFLLKITLSSYYFTWLDGDNVITGIHVGNITF